MITLKNDNLSFQFPEITKTLRRLVEDHTRAVLSRVLIENRQRALEVLRKEWQFQMMLPDLQAKAERHLLAATPAQIEDTLRRQSMATAGLSHADGPATLEVQFQRTLRIPDDGKIYPLPAGLGCFPLRHIDDFNGTVPPTWLERGGVLMPMYQSEALWIRFATSYPFAIKVAAGKINAVTGETWAEGLSRPPQNYLVTPNQPWLDGFAVRKGVIRQFVAMPLGAGYSAEEQITGKAETGGLQLQVYPMSADAYFRSEIVSRLPESIADLLGTLVPELRSDVRYSRPRDYFLGGSYLCEEAPMGLGAGGTMRQEIFEDSNPFEDWDQSLSSRCFVHLCNSMMWRQITDTNPPLPPFTIREYEASGVPWFDYYRDDLAALEGAPTLDAIKSVANLGKIKGEKPLADNQSLDPKAVVQYGNTRRPGEVREWAMS
jgi:hypothetical protein